MDEYEFEYVVMNLRDNMLSIPSLVETEVETEGDTFESRDKAREFIREQTDIEPASSDLQVYAVRPAHQE